MLGCYQAEIFWQTNPNWEDWLPARQLIRRLPPLSPPYDLLKRWPAKPENAGQAEPKSWQDSNLFSQRLELLPRGGLPCGRRTARGQTRLFPTSAADSWKLQRVPAPPWCRIIFLVQDLATPPGASLHAHHHQLLVATTRLCTTFLPPPAAGACQTCTTTKKLARLAPGPAYHSQLSFLRDSPHLLQHRLTWGAWGAWGGGPSLRFSPKTKNHLVRGLRREGWIMSRKKGAG